MMEFIRSRTNSPIVKILFLGILLSFMGLGGASIFGNSGNYVAKVNGEKISEQLVRGEYDYELSRIDTDNLSEEDLKAYKYRAMDRVINQKLIEQKIAEWGFSVTDLDIVNHIRSTPEFQNSEGEFDSERYHQILRASGIDSVAYENGLRHEIAIRRIQQDVMMGSILPSDTADKWAMVDNEERDIELATLYYNQYNDPDLQVSEEEVEMMYESNKESYKTDPRVKLTYLEIKVDQLKAGDLSEEELNKERVSILKRMNDDATLKERIDRAETRLSDQLFIEADNDEALESAESKLAQLATKIAEGELTFQEIVDHLDQYEGLQYMSNGNLSRGIVSESAIDDHLFALTSESPISEPFSTKNAAHLVRLQEISVSRDEAIDNFIKDESHLVHYADLTAELSDLAAKYPFDIERVASELGVELIQTDWLSLTERDSILSYQEVMDIVSRDILINDEDNNESYLLEVDDGLHGMYLHIDNYEESRTETLDEAYAAIEAQILNNKKREILTAKMDQIQDQLIDNPDKSFKELAKEAGFQFDEYRGLTRLKVAEIFGEYSLEGKVISNTFSTSLGEDELAFFVTDGTSEGVGLARVSNIVMGTIDDYDGPEKEYREYFERQNQMQLELKAFIDGLREESKISYYSTPFLN